jgi:hypothetical protein
MLSRFLIPKVQDYYYSSRDRLSRLPAVLAPKHSMSPPSSPQDSFFFPTESPRRSTIHSRFYAGIIGPMSSATKPRSKPPARDPDLESMDFDFHDRSLSPPPAIRTLIAQGPERSARPHTSEKEDDKIYVKREFTTRETILRDASPHGDLLYASYPFVVDRQSTQSTDVETASDILVVPPLAFYDDRESSVGDSDADPGRDASRPHYYGWPRPTSQRY